MSRILAVPTSSSLILTVEQVEADIASLVSQIDSLIDEEQDAYDNLPESLQTSGRDEAMQENVDALTSARDDLETVSSSLESARS